MTPPRRRPFARATAALLRGLIRAYQLGPAYFFQGSCRYEPSCSRYGADAVAAHGALKGGWLAARRICRCHPWGGLGYDPVPAPPGGHASPPADSAGTPTGRLPAAPPRISRVYEF
jgi:hypothetical protein